MAREDDKVSVQKLYDINRYLFFQQLCDKKGVVTNPASLLITNGRILQEATAAYFSFCKAVLKKKSGFQQSQGIKSGLALGVRAWGTFPGVKKLSRLWGWTCCLCGCSGANEDPKCLSSLQEFTCLDKIIPSALIFCICFHGGVLLLSKVLEQWKESSSRASSCALHYELKLGITLKESLLCPHTVHSIH